ncbi:hypothetical protein [Motilibacter aurantiacus]|uniref:hypothetical protein n=1 Tax=Motilibacter aurantiacus TaxID=2714955 RepID=UPI00140BE1A4|nr:hypothetical protein [Motilibacter aurantiacus]NHC45122.1 hypothetical protein [Motilibacter aurantiacus]
MSTGRPEWYCTVAGNVLAPGSGPWYYSNVSPAVSTTSPAAPPGFPGPAAGFCPTREELAAASATQERASGRPAAAATMPSWPTRTPTKSG